MTIFDSYYFAHGCGEPYQRNETWLGLFRWFAERIEQDLQPKTVLDAGCAFGLLVECLRERGIEAWGIDISEYALQNVPESVRPYCSLGSITEPFQIEGFEGQAFDLIVCIEVLEHLAPHDSERAVRNICQHTDRVLFSSSPFDYKEPTHFNVNLPEHWADLFARHGFYRDVDFDASFISPWAVCYQRKSMALNRLVHDYERKFWLLWKENVDLRQANQEMRQMLARQETKLAQLNKELSRVTEQVRLMVNSRTWRLRSSVMKILQSLRGKHH